MRRTRGRKEKKSERRQRRQSDWSPPDGWSPYEQPGQWADSGYYDHFDEDDGIDDYEIADELRRYRSN